MGTSKGKRQAGRARRGTSGKRTPPAVGERFKRLVDSYLALEEVWQLRQQTRRGGLSDLSTKPPDDDRLARQALDLVAASIRIMAEMVPEVLQAIGTDLQNLRPKIERTRAFDASKATNPERRRRSPATGIQAIVDDIVWKMLKAGETPSLKNVIYKIERLGDERSLYVDDGYLYDDHDKGKVQLNSLGPYIRRAKAKHAPQDPAPGRQGRTRK